MADLKPLPSWLLEPVLAVQFLTRLPVPGIARVEDARVGRSLLWYPAVGALIGLLLWLSALLLAALLPGHGQVQAALLLALWCLLTGGLHLDGLADSADAWVGGFGDRARTLALMKDPTCGPVAVMLLVLVLLAKFALVAALIAQGPLWLLLAPALARSYLLLLFLTTGYVRPGGLGAVLTAHLPREAVRNLLVVLGVGLLLTGSAGVWLLALTVPAFMGLRRMMIERLGGTTGDTAGALVELLEVVALLGLVIAVG